MIIKLAGSDFNAILNVINSTAAICKNVIPIDCWKEPYITPEDLKDAVQFYGLKKGNTLVAVIGICHVKDATFIRHMYVLANQQRKGYGEKLLRYVMDSTETSTFLAYTWKAALWNVNFYAKHGFKETSKEEKNMLLHTYCNMPKHQIEASIVLKVQCPKPKTVILKINSQKSIFQKIQKAAEIIQKGGLVAFPTETVYGLGADALNNNAVLSLFKAKNRPLNNPPILHIADTSHVYSLAREIPKFAETLMKQFWPGPLTLIFKRSETIPKETTVGLDTVAIRMPNHSIALALIKQSNTPIAAPSANLSGNPSPTTAQHVYDDLSGKIDAILDGGPTRIGIESTVLDLSVNPPMLLRPGGTTFEDIQAVLPNVALHPFVTSKQEITVKQANSPGMMHKHYAPNAKVLLIDGSLQEMIAKITALSDQYKSEGKKVGILATDETIKKFSAPVVKSMGSRFNLDVIASNLFRELRAFNENSVDIILAESVPLDGLGLAVMNRLRQASGYHIIKA
jgi:L-threonylcarbamoyladenylate synthase